MAAPATRRLRLPNASSEYEAVCGVSTTLCIAVSGESAGSGSSSNTSRPAAPRRPSRNASISASCCTTGPRAVLMSVAVGRIRRS